MNINIRPDGAINRVHVSQNDIGRTLTFNLFNDSLAYTVPVGATVKIQGTKPSGFGFSETCTVSGNTATIDTTEAMTDEYGYIETELQITNSGDVLGTSNFILAVEKNPHPDNITDGTQITAQSLEVRIESLEESALGGLTDEAKQALLNCFAHVAWIDEDGQDYYDALENALYSSSELTSISCVYTQSGTVYDTDSLNDLKSDLVVTAHYDDSSTATVTAYTLSGTLTVGTSTITVSYGGKTTTFTVTVSATPTPPQDYLYNWDFTQSLIDSVNSAEATLTHTSVGSTDATRTSAGIVFDDANELCYLGDFGSSYFVGKTVEIDVAEFDGQIGTNTQHYRLFMLPTSSTKGTGPLIYRKDTGWASYSGSTWSSVYSSAVSGTSTDVLNYFNGKTIKLEFDSSGYCKLYADDVLIGTSDGTFTGSGARYAYLGGIAGDQSYCYNMTISAVRIYET